MGVFQNNLMGAAAAAASAGDDFYTHQIANSVRNSDSQNGTLKITAGTPTSRKTFTYSWWWKRYNVTSTTQSSNVFCAGTGGGTYSFWTFTNGSTPQSNFNFTGGNFGDSRLRTNMLFRDTSAWYHIVMRFDSTQASSSNRVRMYVNGVEPTYSSASVQTDIAQDEDISFMNQSGVVQSWGGISGVGTGAEGCDVQMAEIVFNDGQSYGPDSYGETKNGVWIPKDPSGLTFGNNGYYLKFESNSDLGNDSSGNNNDFTAANLATHDQMLDSPTFSSTDGNGGNFATLNPLASSPDNVLTEGNLKATKETGANYEDTAATMNLKGKYYVECCVKELMGDDGQAVGLVNVAEDLITSRDGRLGETGVSYRKNGKLMVAGTENTFGSVWTAGDIVQMAVDMTDINSVKVWFGLNNTWQNSGNPSAGSGIAATITNGEQIMAMSAGYSGTGELIFNFGQEGTFAGEKTAQGNADGNGYGNFYYAPPTDFLALCSGNLPVADAVDPAQTSDDYPQELFFMSQYAGNLSARTITTENQPDLMFIRNITDPQNWYVLDSTRVITDNKYVLTNTTALEATLPQANITSVGATSVGISSGTWFNSNGSSYGIWGWRANGGTTSTNTQGSANSTVQVDPSGGFSIVKWTGTSDSWSNAITVGHGLSSAPNVMICKKYLGNADQWEVFFSDLGDAGSGANAACNSLVLNTTAALYTNQSFKGFGGVMPTSTVFTVDGNNLNGSSDTIIAYCFANTEGYIKSGVYEGNGNADGSFVYCGFRPALIITKSLDSTSDWQLFDDKRLGYNVDNNEMQLNETDAQVTTDMIDILSNGFKFRIATDPNVAETYVYLAIAHNPFQYATAR
jgi:hypothetical protein